MSPAEPTLHLPTTLGLIRDLRALADDLKQAGARHTAERVEAERQRRIDLIAAHFNRGDTS